MTEVCLWMATDCSEGTGGEGEAEALPSRSRNGYSVRAAIFVARQTRGKCTSS